MSLPGIFNRSLLICLTKSSGDARERLILGRRLLEWVVPLKTTDFTEGLALERRHEGNAVIFSVIRQADGTYNVEASDGGPPEFLISFRTEVEAEAWIAKLKGMAH